MGRAVAAPLVVDDASILPSALAGDQGKVPWDGSSGSRRPTRGVENLSAAIPGGSGAARAMVTCPRIRGPFTPGRRLRPLGALSESTMMADIRRPPAFRSPFIPSRLTAGMLAHDDLDTKRVERLAVGWKSPRRISVPRPTSHASRPRLRSSTITPPDPSKRLPRCEAVHARRHNPACAATLPDPQRQRRLFLHGLKAARFIQSHEFTASRNIPFSRLRKILEPSGPAFLDSGEGDLVDCSAPHLWLD